MTHSVSHTPRPAMTPAGADLYDSFMQLTRRMLVREPHAHLHFCACGDALVCSQEPDKCLVSAHWDCPACEFEKEMAR